jgi:hypothetical protein
MVAICVSQATLLMLVTGCASQMTTIAKSPPAHYEVLGKATGNAKGTMLLGPTAYNFIPTMLNSRVDRAYNAALCSVPGATGLINVTVQENWCCWLIGSTKSVTITGDAIKETK